MYFFFLLFIYLFFYYLKQNFSVYPWVPRNCLWRANWPWTYSDLLASASQVLELYVWATIPEFCVIGIELRVSRMLGKHSFNWAIPQSSVFLREKVSVSCCVYAGVLTVTHVCFLAQILSLPLLWVCLLVVLSHILLLPYISWVPPTLCP